MKRFALLCALILELSTWAQNQLKSYQWRDHLPYTQAISVCNQGNKIYVAANECAFAYHKGDNSYERLNKVYGYSDIEPILMRNNPYNNVLMIVYKNSNIDILKNGVITNAPDLYRKQNIGDKTVNSVTFSGPYAYLACSFGIVVFNTETFEFKDTYIIGPNASNELVYQVALSGTDIYAATKNGLFRASLSSSNLSSFTSWSLVNNIPSGTYNNVVFFGGKVIASHSLKIQSGTNMRDTLYQFDGTSWTLYPNKPYIGGSYIINKLRVSDAGSQLMILDQWGFESYDASGNKMGHMWDLGYSYSQIQDVIPDPTDVGWFWIATSTQGLLIAENDPPNDKGKNVRPYIINGPGIVSSSDIDIMSNKLIMAPSYLDVWMYNNYYQNNVQHFYNGTWGEASANDSIQLFDFNEVAFDPNDASHYFASSWGDGLVEYRNDAQVGRYDYSNTSNALHTPDIQGVYITRASGLAFDKNNNLWIGIGETQNCLSARKPDGSFVSMNFTNINSVNGSPGPLPRVSHVIVDSSQQVWVVAYNLGLFVYKYDGSYTQPNASNAKLLVNLPGRGGLPSIQIISIAEDKNGDIWVGTDKGIYVFYNPESIFTTSSGWDAQPIYIQQDGKTQLLLQTEEIVAIAVDGANNKWFGTKSGVYCFSPDGQKQLYHFTTDNSPLFSNAITTLRVHPTTGEVFIGTDKGLLSFQNTVIEGFSRFTNVYAYPNPVKPNYDGPILIHGMISGAVVRIVDVAGNFVYETTSHGGQAVWNGKNFSGQRVASGVYLVLCSTTDGDKQVMTKILVLN